MLKKLLGIAPKLESDGSYSPSKLAIKLGTVSTSDFENITYTKYKGRRSKILVIFTEQKNMEMKNGKLFSTGNHPIEALVPMLHLKNAGFDFEIAALFTETYSASVPICSWGTREYTKSPISKLLTSSPVSKTIPLTSYAMLLEVGWAEDLVNFLL